MWSNQIVQWNGVTRNQERCEYRSKNQNKLLFKQFAHLLVKHYDKEKKKKYFKKGTTSSYTGFVFDIYKHLIQNELTNFVKI